MDEDISLKMRTLVDEIVDDILSSSHVEQFPLATDVSMILSESPEVEIISRLESSEKTLVLQPRCVDQKRGGYCGHYALRNILWCLEERNPASLTQSLPLWRRYWTSIRLLLERSSRENNWWPWTERDICSGLMERTYLEHVLRHDSQVLETNSQIQVLQYAYGSLLSDVSDVLVVQESIDQFRSQSQSSLSFILGVTNHWVAIFVQKIASRVNLIYFDSYNVPVLTANPDELKLIMDEKEEDHRKRKGRGWTAKEKEETVQAYEDQKKVVLMLAHCCSGNTNLKREMAKETIHSLITSFSEHVEDLQESEKKTDTEDGFDKSEYVVLLSVWLETRYHPKQLCDALLDRLCQLGLDQIDDAEAALLRAWSRNIRTRVGSFVATRIDVIIRLEMILDTVESILLYPNQIKK